MSKISLTDLPLEIFLKICKQLILPSSYSGSYYAEDEFTFLCQPAESRDYPPPSEYALKELKNLYSTCRKVHDVLGAVMHKSFHLGRYIDQLNNLKKMKMQASRLA